MTTTVGHDVALGLVALGTAIIVAASLGALAVRNDELTRVHFLTPVTSLGAPLVGAGICVAEGWGITDGQIIVILVLLFVTGPVLGAATGRLIAQHDHLIDVGSPE